MRTSSRQTVGVLILALSGACRSDSVSGATTSGVSSPINHGTLVSSEAPSAHQQETTLAQSTTGRIVTAWIGWITTGSGISTIEYTVSDDGGTTWAHPRQIPIPTDVLALSDPALAVDSNGNFTLVALGDGPNMGVYVFRLPAGGAAFGDPITVARGSQADNTLFDKTWIVTTANGLLVTYNLHHAKDTLGIAATSRDATTWTLDTMPMRQQAFVNPCADGNNVTTAYMAPDGAVSVVSSRDGGATWTAPVPVATSAAIVSGFGVTVPSCIRHDDTVWVLAANQGFVVKQSTNGGASFTSRAGLTTAASQAQLSVRADGTIDVVYYYERSSSEASLMHTRVTPVSSAFTTPDTIRSGLHVGGNPYGVDGFADYVGLIPGAGTFTDNASKTSHIAFFKLP